LLRWYVSGPPKGGFLYSIFMVLAWMFYAHLWDILWRALGIFVGVYCSFVDVKKVDAFLVYFVF